MKTDTSTRNALRHEAPIRRLLAEGLTREQVSATLKISASSLMKYCKILEIEVPRVVNTDSLGNNPDSLGRMLVMRAEGHSLEQIGQKMGVSRERIRQIFARKCPDIAIQPRLKSYKLCRVCDKPHYGGGQTCSKECSRSFRRTNRWSRDEALHIMRLRDEGRTWAEVALRVHGNADSATWRTKLQREAEFILSSDERRRHMPTREQYQEDASERPRPNWMAAARARIMQIFDDDEKPD